MSKLHTWRVEFIRVSTARPGRQNFALRSQFKRSFDCFLRFESVSYDTLIFSSMDAAR